MLEFPLTELFENRDYQGSTHFFFDIGHGNLLAFFDFPGLDLGKYVTRARLLAYGGLINVDDISHRGLRKIGDADDQLDAVATDPLVVFGVPEIYGNVHGVTFYARFGRIALRR